MTASMTAVDFSTYQRRTMNDWPGADETKKLERQEREGARLVTIVVGLAATTLPMFIAHVGWGSTNADYSVLGGEVAHQKYAASVPNTSLPAPLPFLDSHYEMLSYKNLEDGWDDISSSGISAEAVDTALAFLSLLPADVLAPEASASGDGTVDWYWRNDQFAATVTFYPDGRVAYFASTSAGRVKDSFKYSGSVPAELIESLRQL